ncbi:MAG: pitrilysin family protein [Armatimonadota bacterium]|nr:pitrilysin family protein [Armatimonadota bacterium]MDR7422749.1 pitrilysin family protein [Armatimonadota bacterium]MDR7454941.1 pitrilysin family protein [Armatimonadota bacterium]MDR7456610.1 pitrilysin family protein [Armatimonadota bacterium]MDR7497754.1 pitrilysin family protein [Armatimonadota bacterium]
MNPPIAAAEVARAVLPNGLTCLAKASPGAGMVALCAYVRAGAMYDGDQPGLARFVGASLVRGTHRHRGPDLAEALDAMGASLSASAGIETVSLAAHSLSDDLPRLLGFAAEVLVDPAFPPDEVERVRGELLTAIRVNGLDTRQVAERLFRRLAYPADHPHSRSPDGDEATVAGLDRAALQAFHRMHYVPGAAILAVVGDVEPGAALDQVAAAFAGWHGDAPLPLPAGRAAPPAAVVRGETPVPGKSQSDLVLGVPGASRRDPDYYALMMANLLLGQLGLMGRIGQRVREKLGVAYYAYSDLRAGLLAGPWWVRAGVNPVNVDRAVAAILAEIETLQSSGPAPDELEDARTFLTGSLAVRLESTPGLAQMLADIELYGLGLDYLERYAAIIGAVSRDAIVRAAHRFPTTAYVLAVAGPDRSAA